MSLRVLVALRIDAPPEAVFLHRHGEWWRALLAGLAARANSRQLEAAGEGDS